MNKVIENIINRDYNNDFIQFKKENYFFTELDFVKMLLQTYTLNQPHPCLKSVLDNDHSYEPQMFDYNLTGQYIAFLERKKQQLEAKLEAIVETAYFQENSLNWIGGQTALIELAKALIENGNVKGGTQQEIINKIAAFFNVEIKNQNKLINDLKIRNLGAETLFLDKLKKTLFDYITAEKDK